MSRFALRDLCRARKITYAECAAEIRKITGTDYPTEGTIKLVASGHRPAGRKLIDAICKTFSEITPNDFFESDEDPNSQVAAGE